MLQPVGRFANIQQAKDFFNNARQKNIDFVQLTNENLRNRYWQHPATGTIDLYQTILLLSAHCERHAAQIEEVKKGEGYPK